MKFYCIGDSDTVMGFRFAGVEGTVIESPAQAREELRRIAALEDVGVIIIPDQVAEHLAAEINQIRFTRARPAVVEIPGPLGTREGRPKLLDLIREAIGIRV